MKRNSPGRIAPMLLLLFLLSASAQAADEAVISSGQTVYVPAYSHVYFGDREGNFLLTVTLSVRNTDCNSPITLSSVDYYDTDGKMVRAFLERPLSIAPMASKSFTIAESDKAGGLGANFLVRWNAAKTVNAPIIESVMIGTRSQQGISFTSRGREVLEKAR
ncbi:MAG: DUF3124 domain-containing protein [Thermodesulfobacteriota bacterium]